jgi:serine/threonine protein kinase
MALITPGGGMGPDSENFVPVSPGDVIAEKYRVERVLGRGGMGVVVAATHLHLDQPVALKFIIPGAVGQDSQAVERFMREARAAGKLRSEHVAKVYDVGMLAAGAPYIVMEYLEGRDLSAVVEADGALEPDIAADYVMQACEAMAEAHSLGIIHRDIKPQNLFLTKGVGGKALVKVLDFGVSKVRTPGTVDKGLTSTASIMGSPMYMAPEQMRSARSADARSDIWALGVVLYTLLTGDAPFIAETMTELALKVVQDAHPPVTLRRPNAGLGLSAVVDRCLEKDPANRYADVSDLAIALSEFAPPGSRVLAEHTRAILKRKTDPPPRTGSMPSAPSIPSMQAVPAHAQGQGLPDRTIVSAGEMPMASTSAGWSHSSKTNRTKGIVGVVAFLALALGVLGVLARGRHAPDAETTPAKIVSTPAPIAADPAPPPPAAPTTPPAPTVAPASPASDVASTHSVVDASAPLAPAPRPGKQGGSSARDTGRHGSSPAPSSTHDDEIPALR